MVVGTWTGTDTSGWAGTMTINADHSFTFNGVSGGTVYNASGTWSIVTPGTMLTVEPSNSVTENDRVYQDGAIDYYSISGNTMTYTESDASGVTTTLNK